MRPGDDTVKLLKTMITTKTVPEFLEAADGFSKDGYSSMTVNLVLGDTSGNIGYLLGCAHPVRKDKTPYIGCRVLDGETTEFDWEDGLLPLDKLPRSINPAKGYLMTANNRQSPDNALYDYGATIMSTGRAQRIDEMIRE